MKAQTLSKAILNEWFSWKSDKFTIASYLKSEGLFDSPQLKPYNKMAIWRYQQQAEELFYD